MARVENPDDFRGRIRSIRERLRVARAAPEHRRVQEDVARLVSELRPRVRNDPAVALEAALALVEDLVRGAAAISWDPRGDDLLDELSDAVDQAVGVVGSVLQVDARRTQHAVDRESGFVRLFAVWQADQVGVLGDFARRLLQLASVPADELILRRLAADALGEIPLPFPEREERPLDARRADLADRRWTLDRLVAELLARRGVHDYGVTAARQRLRVTGESEELVAALVRAGEPDDAAALARARATASEAKEKGLANLIADVARRSKPDRRARLAVETGFVHEPTPERFDLLRRAVAAEVWPRVRARVLGHLQKHQRCPDLVFELYVREGLIRDADGLVVTQPVNPDLLQATAVLIQDDHPVVAAGWLIVCAYRLADRSPHDGAEEIAQVLLQASALAHRAGGVAEFSRALRRFRSRHADDGRIVRCLEAAGL